MNLYKTLLVYVIPLFITTATIERYVISIASTKAEAWLKNDIELNSNLVAYSLTNALIRSSNKNELLSLETSLRLEKRNERLLAFAFCKEGERFYFKTNNFPNEIECNSFKNSDWQKNLKKQLLIKPIDVFNQQKIFQGQLILAYNLSLINKRVDEIENHLSHLFTMIFCLLITLVLCGRELEHFLKKKNDIKDQY